MQSQEKQTIEITYVYHDCFVARTARVVLVFDFWRRPEGWLESASFAGGSPLMESDRSKKIYVFVSHFHKDHFNKEIFRWSRDFEDITYILSRDVVRHARHILRADTLYKGPRPRSGSVVALAPGESWSDGEVNVDAFDSTDIGNSYVAHIGGITLMHAGDLNAWIWKDESTPQEVESARKAFLSILAPLAKKHPRLDVAMFPVDSRIGSDYWEGARLLLRKTEVANFLPMHFCLGESTAEKERLRRDALDFRAYANPETTTRYVGLTAPGDKIVLQLRQTGVL